MKDGSLRQVYKEVEEPLDSKCGVIALNTVSRALPCRAPALCWAEPLHPGGRVYNYLHSIERATEAHRGYVTCRSSLS